MGATTFMHTSRGETPKEAFAYAVEDALYEHGHGGYTGTIAEKSDFVLISVPAGKKAREYANELMDNGDDRIDDKWGPAGCINLGEGNFLFFGWASC